MMGLSEGDTWIGSGGRTSQSQQGTPACANQREQPVERHIIAQPQACIGTPQFADEQLIEFRSRSVPWQQERLNPQLPPMNHIVRPKWMVLGTAGTTRSLQTDWIGLCYESNINCRTDEIGDQLDSRSVD
ncbi:MULTISPECIES: hypothetical protein [unclassified Bradyrhizobium]|uniref:hypothetical protein n=1 Tax=unclassified Bradyrhizobium TaxID=2631580 RepID=UPI001CD1E6AB|nr:hypothetical protein [Bradyrhizobium sp. IC4061]MCA1525008.1 hypothetical protein [Bradyrhizobium yuanmingense]